MRTAGYKHYGLNRGTHDGKAGLWYREWAPGAKALALVGEFNDWTPTPEQWAAAAHRFRHVYQRAADHRPTVFEERAGAGKE